MKAKRIVALLMLMALVAGVTPGMRMPNVQAEEIAFDDTGDDELIDLADGEDEEDEDDEEVYYVDVEVRIISEWDHHYNAEVDVINMSDKRKITDWEISFKFPDKIEKVWNAQITGHDEEKGVYTIKNVSWNRDIPLDEDVTFGMTVCYGDTKGELDDWELTKGYMEEAEDAKVTIKNAKGGLHSTWSLDDKGTLTVKGKGKVTLDSELFRSKAGFVKKIVVDKGITAIGDAAFSGCYNATNIVLPDTLQTLERHCFSGCSSLEKIVIPDSVTQMGKRVFQNCQKLKTVVLPKNLKKANALFHRCYALRTIRNRSSLPIKLDTASGHRVWRVNGKKMTVLKPGKTAKTRGTKYRISYDLRGGKALDRLPKSRYYGEEVDIPRAEKEGFEFIGWHRGKVWILGGEFLTMYEGDITLTAHFLSRNT